jgi:hypothetical protein
MSEDHQWLRNQLSRIEDDARACRNQALKDGEDPTPFNLIAQLTQIIREEIVK